MSETSKVYDMDCRKFHDPHGETRHIGWHPSIVVGLVQHRKFAGFLQGLRPVIEKMLTKYVVVPVLALWCNKGRHRSVAMSVILGHCLEAMGVTAMTFHLAQDSWHRGSCGGEGCKACLAKSAVKDKALASALQLWSE